jgi:hypothetical protein
MTKTRAPLIPSYLDMLGYVISDVSFEMEEMNDILNRRFERGESICVELYDCNKRLRDSYEKLREAYELLK